MTDQKKCKKSDIKNQCGFTLLEVLISVAILSVGLLAVTAMQGASFTETMFGSRMSVATNLTDEMMERMRLKMPGVSTPAAFQMMDYNGIDTSNAFTRPPATAWQARGDYDQWAMRIQQNLPGGAGRVIVTQPVPNPQNRNDIAVTITWPGVGRVRTITMRTSILS